MLFGRVNKNPEEGLWVSMVHEVWRLQCCTAGTPYRGDRSGLLRVAMTPVVDRGGHYTVCNVLPPGLPNSEIISYCWTHAKFVKKKVFYLATSAQ